MTANTKLTLTTSKQQLQDYKGDMLVLGLFADTKRLDAQYKALDGDIAGALSSFIKLGDFKAYVNDTTIIYTPTHSKCQRIMLVGLGDKKKCTTNTLRQAAGTAIRRAAKLSISQLGLAIHSPVVKILANKALDAYYLGCALAEGLVAGSYDYTEFITDANKSKNTIRVSLLDVGIKEAAHLNRGWKIGQILAQGQNQTRTIANKPGNVINPDTLAIQAKAIARKKGLKCKVYNHKKLTELKMGGILAVGSGSAHKPCLIRMEYKGKKTGKWDVILVGKAITFDSGGISLKPSAKMDTMKYDKSGGCTILGVMSMLSRLKLKLNVMGLVPAAENMPSHSSYRPGDIITTYSGKTVEIQNTDAEGRMILCDALALAAELKPAVIIDIATLTGACVVALGRHNAGLFGNNDKLLANLQAAGKMAGENTWILPSSEEYLEQMKSKMADLKNTGGREGGSCTAAAFLGEFVNGNCWGHIDIAAVADTSREVAYRGRGATGFATRLLGQYLLNL